MEYFGMYLKKLRKAKGLSQEELAKELDMSKSAISNYETGYSSPSKANLRKLSAFFGVDFRNIPPGLDEPRPSTYGTTNIAVYDSVYADDLVPKKVLYSLNFPTTFLGEGKFFGLKIKNDQMDRAMIKEDSVLLVRSQHFADEGDIVVAAIEDKPAFVARYYAQNGTISLVFESNNPIHRPLITNSEIQKITILGKVLKCLNAVM